MSNDRYLDAARGPLQTIGDAAARKEIGKLWDVVEGRLTRSGDQQLATLADVTLLERRISARIDALPQAKATVVPPAATESVTTLGAGGGGNYFPQGIVLESDAKMRLAGNNEKAVLFGTRFGQLRFYANEVPIFGIENSYLAFAHNGDTVFGCEGYTARPLFHWRAVDNDGYLRVVILGLGERRIALESIPPGKIMEPVPDVSL